MLSALTGTAKQLTEFARARRSLVGLPYSARKDALSGAITLIQRFGSAAKLHIHLHALVLDGVYQASGDGAPVFIEATTPGNAQLQTLLGKNSTRWHLRLS